ncbi:mediator of RNA polymerase II transcription subunit 10 isoform X2 [Kogia breviceps]|uniref:mediator of RNA polymerase II transcription subunit 10 isoform X2 n=1 Tax=Kogia breviceps TaxID=27615 RepID=UPI0034D17951
MAEKFDHLEEHLEKFVENIRQLGIIVSDFQPSSQAGLNQKLNFIVTGLQDIDKCRQQLHDITVPLEVFEYPYGFSCSGPVTHHFLSLPTSTSTFSLRIHLAVASLKKSRGRRSGKGWVLSPLMVA